MAPCCEIVPPYLLRGIVNSVATETADNHKQAAQRSLAARDAYTTRRTARLADLTKARGGKQPKPAAHQSIVPDYLLRTIVTSADVDDETKARAQRDLTHIEKVHGAYQAKQGLAAEGASTPQKTLAAETDKTHFYRAVYDANHTEDEDALPGKQLRVEGQAACKDGPANEAFDNAGLVLKFYKEVFDWTSIDNENMHVLSSVHFGKDYENAFWDPDKMQMVYGDGHDFLYHFTKCLDVIGHELTHAVTEHTSPLNYTGQSGALNEHVSDVFGVMVKQYSASPKETAEQADWLIGEGCLLPGVKGVALRSMKSPGTAYDDPRFGKDPQPASMAGYDARETDDNGGVHMFSGIPNRAFYLACLAMGGYSWETAGKVWWKTMNSGRIPAKCTFLQFADVTVDIAEEEFGEEGAKKVREAWTTVGVVRKGH